MRSTGGAPSRVASFLASAVNVPVVISRPLSPRPAIAPRKSRTAPAPTLPRYRLQCEATTGIAPFARLARQVMTTEPYASADRVFWIVDNGSSHRGAASIRRMAKAWPNAHLIHLPVHASWLDQAEIYFSVVQRKALSPNDFTALDQIRGRLAAFEARYNAIARPFSWKFTRTDLDDLLHRIDAHDQTQPHALAA